jgi:outer membrane lipoprotein LolB
VTRPSQPRRPVTTRCARPARRPAARLLATLLAALILGGCALQRPEPAGSAADWDARRAALATLTGWQARGRIAIKSDTRGGQGDLRWQQQGDTTRIRVSGPFGAGAYEIRWDPQRLTVASRDGEFTRAYTGADAAEQFLTEQLGWSFPAVSTRYWLLGLADPAHPAIETRAPDGSLATLDQNGWTITYDRYADQSGTPMPTRLTVQNPQARLRLVIDHWCLAPTCD